MFYPDDYYPWPDDPLEVLPGQPPDPDELAELMEDDLDEE